MASSGDILVPAPEPNAIPIWFVTNASLPCVLSALPQDAQQWVRANGFEPIAGQCLCLPGGDGGIAGVLFALETDLGQKDAFLPGRLASLLPSGLYRFANRSHDDRLACLAWLTELYRFKRYKSFDEKNVRLVMPDGPDRDELLRAAEAVQFGRDLINTPANDLGPEEIEGAMRALARKHGARLNAIIGDDLLEQNFPMIHAVGRASSRPPRLLDLVWGADGDPKISLIGKGVAFDTGGLNVKPDGAMLLMKKDMGGAAAVLAAASMIMDAKPPIRLRVLVPAVENAISGSAFRPGDVLISRSGLTVEIGNTDAEGRLILADALALADEEAPDLLVSMATLTGAARVALGPDLPALFTRDDHLAAALEAQGLSENDPMWRLPLWPPYDAMLKSKVADVSHISGNSFAGAIMAALFLNRFVGKAKAYAHLDMFAWTASAKPGRPEGGEVMGARALVAYLRKTFSGV